ncbi:hypothetical protein MALU111345_19425 [Marinicrinis lubricantis]
MKSQNEVINRIQNNLLHRYQLFTWEIVYLLERANIIQRKGEEAALDFHIF